MRQIDGVNYYSIPEAGQYLGAHHQSVRRWVKSGRLPSVGYGERQVISEQALRDFIQHEGMTVTTGTRRVMGPGAGRVYFAGHNE